jgi:polyisoprenoid-binding protein YceI
MRLQLRTLPIAALALLGRPALVAAQSLWPEAALRSGTLSFDGKSSLGDFTGVTATLRGQMSGGARLADVTGWVEAPVVTLKTGNDRRDRDLVKTMEATVYPTIRFQLERVTPQAGSEDSTAATLEGDFTIHGVTRRERIVALVVRTADGIRVTASLPMNLHDYKINKLTRFLVFKMNPAIVVHIEVIF